MNDTTVNDLKKIGLEEKEARVYVAALELGASPVQKIAVRSSVPRATTYLVLEELKDRGLVTTFEKGKKTFFAAEPPQRLHDLVEAKSFEIRQQEILLKKLVPELITRGQFEKSARPVVRYYEGIKALRSYVRDVLAGDEKEVVGIVVEEEVNHLFERAGLSPTVPAKIRQKTKTGRRIIRVWKSDTALLETEKKDDVVNVSFKDLPLQADITIKGNRVGFMPYSEPMRGVIIEDKAITAAINLLFEGIWQKHK